MSLVGVMSGRVRAVVAGVFGAATLLLPAPPAEAAVRCELDEFEQPHVFLEESGERVSLRVSGTDIQFNPGSGWESCAGATTSSTLVLSVWDLSSGNVSVTIDLSGGPFAPGFDDEPGDSDEIEWAIRLGGGSGDRLLIRGTPGPDEWTFGRDGFNLNPAEEGFGTGSDFDNDAVAFSGVNLVVMHGLGGLDGLRATGGVGTGGPLSVRTALLGHGSMDVLEGGAARDRIKGGPGGDEISGGAAGDVLLGGIGGDEIAGGPGADSIRGGSGDDNLFGNAGSDTLSGGPGMDWCSGGMGIDRLLSCERGPRD